MNNDVGKFQDLKGTCCQQCQGHQHPFTRVLKLPIAIAHLTIIFII